MPEQLGKILIIFGVVLVVVGLLFLLSAKVKFIGHLPGDIQIKKERFTFYFPIVTCIVISIILTIILNVIFRR
jgi:hypothetical protein